MLVAVVARAHVAAQGAVLAHLRRALVVETLVCQKTGAISAGARSADVAENRRAFDATKHVAAFALDQHQLDACLARTLQTDVVAAVEFVRLTDDFFANRAPIQNRGGARLAKRAFVATPRTRASHSAAVAQRERAYEAIVIRVRLIAPIARRLCRQMTRFAIHIAIVPFVEQ